MRLLWYRFNHWLRHSPLVLLLGLLLGGLALGLVTSSTTWPSTSDRSEVLTALGSIAALALLLLSTSLTRIMGQVAFAAGLYSPRNAARLLSRPLVIWSSGLFVAVIGCAGAAALARFSATPESSVSCPLRSVQGCSRSACSDSLP